MPGYAIRTTSTSNELYHHGILGQKWGVRRYQNYDGSLKAAGKARYGSDEISETTKKGKQKSASRIAKEHVKAAIKNVREDPDNMFFVPDYKKASDHMAAAAAKVGKKKTEAILNRQLAGKTIGIAAGSTAATAGLAAVNAALLVGGGMIVPYLIGGMVMTPIAGAKMAIDSHSQNKQIKRSLTKALNKPRGD